MISSEDLLQSFGHQTVQPQIVLVEIVVLDKHDLFDIPLELTTKNLKDTKDIRWARAK
jgi:hypothetical protein